MNKIDISYDIITGKPSVYLLGASSTYVYEYDVTISNHIYLTQRYSTKLYDSLKSKIQKVKSSVNYVFLLIEANNNSNS